jgi:hypothetical protein
MQFDRVKSMICEQPIDLAPVLRALAASPSRPLEVESCTVEQLNLLKVAR